MKLPAIFRRREQNSASALISIMELTPSMNDEHLDQAVWYLKGVVRARKEMVEREEAYYDQRKIVKEP